MDQRRFNDENDVKREGKGKGKEKECPKSSSLIPTTESGSSNTMQSSPQPEAALSRLASSAASLTSGFMSSRAHGQYNINLLPSGKAGSSGTLQSPGVMFQETTQITHGSLPNVQPPLGTTFRHTAGQSGGSSKENDFSAFLGTTEYVSDELNGSGSDQEESESRHVTHAVAVAMNDGSEVVDLLETGLIEEGDDDDDELFVTREELGALRRALFEGKPSTGIAWDNALNFVPEFISNGGSSEEYRQLAQHLGVSGTTEARDIWFSQWENILSSYTDEVWGDLRPMVMAAREELQGISTSPEGTTTHGLDAVRRLQQILAHVRGSLK
ncbi:hypothetical protein HD806DRAFT_172627 [Xylariaceae sp. AK1471]|nr:hypothetical protein HD806DRAFT_172627 [Xylariaceae sp. AK1471]